MSNATVTAISLQKERGQALGAVQFDSIVI